MNYKISWVAQTGTYHAAQGIPCQDQVYVCREGGTVCAALADGAGSRESSHIGAACVTRVVAELACVEFARWWDWETEELTGYLLRRCPEELERQSPPIYELASTLLFFATDGEGRYLSGHLGDGVQVRVTPEGAEVFSPPENGPEMEAIQILPHRDRATLPGREALSVILQAIRYGRMVEYEYRTRDDPRPRGASALPWKVEYGAFDRRWWVIFYDPAQRRTIKARMGNLSRLRLGDAATIHPDEVEAAMDRLLEPEPVILRVTPTRGALERCFLAFEDQLFVETRQESRKACTLRFRWYRFDRGVILRRLLYLGSGVTLLGPSSLQQELLALIRRDRGR